MSILILKIKHKIILCQQQVVRLLAIWYNYRRRLYYKGNRKRLGGRNIIIFIMSKNYGNTSKKEQWIWSGNNW